LFFDNIVFGDDEKMEERYKTIHKKGKDEITINKSRFIGHVLPISSEEDALDFLNEIKSIYKDATHNVYGYVFGENNNIQRYSDDGEPQGTAGIPILEVIKKEDLRNVAVVVTRYFGGIKLGAGGLIRAYTKSAKIAIESGIIVEKVLHRKLIIKIDYSIYGKVENFFLSRGIIISNVIFNEAVNIEVFVSFFEKSSFISSVIDLCNGRVEIEELGEKYLSLKDCKKID
jgi:uncharacterized YigZ family protein